MSNKKIRLIAFVFGPLVFGKIIKARADVDLSFLPNLDRLSFIFFKVCKDRSESIEVIDGIRASVESINSVDGYVRSKGQSISRFNF